VEVEAQNVVSEFVPLDAQVISGAAFLPSAVRRMVRQVREVEVIGSPKLEELPMIFMQVQHDVRIDSLVGPLAKLAHGTIGFVEEIAHHLVPRLVIELENRVEVTLLTGVAECVVDAVGPAARLGDVMRGNAPGQIIEYGAAL
jgi:hypothetical protein